MEEQTLRTTVNTKKKRRSPFTVGINLPSYFEGFRRRHVRVGSSHSQDDGVRVGDVLQDQISDLDLNVFGLVSNRNLIQRRLLMSWDNDMVT